MFEVRENGRPADSKNFDVHPSWNNARFQSLDEAQAYAEKWLGKLYWPGAVLIGLGQKYVYNGTDYIEIVRTRD